MGYYAGDYYTAGDYYAAGGRMAKLKGLGKLVKKHKGKLGALAALAGKAKGLHAVPGRRRHRRMHVTNVKALRRSMRRVQGFAKLARKTIGFTHRVHMKKHRRR